MTGAWGKSQNAADKVRILADPKAEFTKVQNKLLLIIIPLNRRNCH